MRNIIQAGQNPVIFFFSQNSVAQLIDSKLIFRKIYFLLRSLMKGSVGRLLRIALTVFYCHVPKSILGQASYWHARTANPISQFLCLVFSTIVQSQPFFCSCHRPPSAYQLFFPAFSPQPISPPIVGFIKENGGGRGCKTSPDLSLTLPCSIHPKLANNLIQALNFTVLSWMEQEAWSCQTQYYWCWNNVMKK